MTRTALLFSYEDISLNYNADIERMHNFLLTRAGGAWSENEIVITSGGNLESFYGLLRQISEKSDFLLLYISLRCGSVRNSTEVRLGPDCPPTTEKKLEGWCKAQVNVFDCCSRMLSEEESEALYYEYEGLYPELGDVPDTDSVLQTRSVFDSNLKHAGNRQVSLYPCGNGCRTFDNPLRGGIFTQFLLDAADSLYKKDSLSGADPFMWQHAARLAAGNVALETGGEQRAECA